MDFLLRMEHLVGEMVGSRNKMRKWEIKNLKIKILGEGATLGLILGIEGKIEIEGLGRDLTLRIATVLLNINVKKKKKKPPEKKKKKL